MVLRKIQIIEDDLGGKAIRALLQEHVDEMRRITPPESVHALDIESLKAPDITFWTAWGDTTLLGCGALKELDARNGEVKSMRTCDAARGSGVASHILEHLVKVARARGMVRLMLETGSFDEFTPARRFYEKHGFQYRGPFADYVEDENTVFMERMLPERPSSAKIKR